MVSGPGLSSTRARVLLLAAMIALMTGLISSVYPSAASLIRANQMNVITLKTVPLRQLDPVAWPDCSESRSRSATALESDEYVQGMAELRSHAYVRWLSKDCTGALERWALVAEREELESNVSSYTVFWSGMTHLAVHGQEPETLSLLRQSNAAPYFAMLGKVASDRGDAALGQRWYELSFAITPSPGVAEALSRIYITKDQFQIARDVWVGLADAVEEESEVWLRAQGEISFLKGDWSRSAQLFERALKMNQNDRVLISRERRAYWMAENWPEVARIARIEIDLSPEREEPYLALADAFMKMEQFDQAEAVLDLAAQRFPQSWYIPLRQGQLACKRAPLSVAQEYFDRASANSAPTVQVEQAAQMCVQGAP